MGRPLAWFGVLIFGVAWFVPVVKGQEMFGALSDMGRELGNSVPGDAPGGGSGLTVSGPKGNAPPGMGPSWLPGWGACRFAWEMLTGGADGPPEAWKGKVLGATCLTNVLMLLAILMLLGQKSGNPLLSLLLLVAAGLNASWIYLNLDGKPFEMFAAGYYLWTVSFVMVGLGLKARAADGGA